MAENKINLRELKDKYKLIVPIDVEHKFRILLNKIYNIEWSGVLFYTYEGSFETKDLVIICKDVLPLNIGNSTFTEFNLSPEVASYMVDNDLLDCQQGLVH